MHAYIHTVNIHKCLCVCMHVKYSYQCNSTYIYTYMYVCRYVSTYGIPYSGKFSQDKNFADFAVSLTSVKIKSAN